MCLYIDKVIPTYLPLKAIQNADRCHIVKIIKIIKTFQLLNIYPTPSTARHFTCFQSSQSSYQDIIIPSSQLQKQTQKKKKRKKKGSYPKLLSYHHSGLPEFKSLHLPTILADQDLNQRFSTAGHNHLVGHESKLIGQTLFINERDKKSVSHEGKILFHEIHQFQYYIHIYKAAM